MSDWVDKGLNGLCAAMVIVMLVSFAATVLTRARTHTEEFPAGWSIVCDRHGHYAPKHNGFVFTDHQYYTRVGAITALWELADKDQNMQPSVWVECDK